MTDPTAAQFPRALGKLVTDPRITGALVTEGYSITVKDWRVVLSVYESITGTPVKLGSFTKNLTNWHFRNGRRGSLTWELKPEARGTATNLAEALQGLTRSNRNKPKRQSEMGAGAAVGGLPYLHDNASILALLEGNDAGGMGNDGLGQWQQQPPMMAQWQQPPQQQQQEQHAAAAARAPWDHSNPAQVIAGSMRAQVAAALGVAAAGPGVGSGPMGHGAAGVYAGQGLPPLPTPPPLPTNSSGGHSNGNDAPGGGGAAGGSERRGPSSAATATRRTPDRESVSNHTDTKAEAPVIWTSSFVPNFYPDVQFSARDNAPAPASAPIPAPQNNGGGHPRGATSDMTVQGVSSRHHPGVQSQHRQAQAQAQAPRPPADTDFPMGSLPDMLFTAEGLGGIDNALLSSELDLLASLPHGSPPGPHQHHHMGNGHGAPGGHVGLPDLLEHGWDFDGLGQDPFPPRETQGQDGLPPLPF